MDTKVIELAALGRPFSLGMLYDCRQDSLIPGYTLWDCEDLGKDTRKRPQKNTEFEIVASESIEDKTSSLNVQASLKASFLGGLVEVEGSAKYLNDSKTTQNQARVTFKYKATTMFEELSMNHLGRGNVDHPHVFESGIATHVVTGILYGAQAFFVFDREVSDEENREEIEGSLKAEINKIPCVSIGGEASLKMKDTDMAKVEKFSCKFHGDFALNTTPVSFTDALQVYQSLPQLLGTNGENAVPVKVWLMPLKVLDSKAAQLVREISIGLVNEAQSVLEDIGELELKCNDALKSTVAQQFPQISKKLRAFKDLCEEYKLDFKKTLAKKLPSLRGGGEEESVLAEILKRRHSSPFNNKDLSEWMRCKEREINIISSLTSIMKNTKVVSSESEFDKIILSSETEKAVCFAFTSLQTAEPYLSSLSSYLRETPKQVNTQDTALHTCDVEEEQWYFSKELFEKLRQKAKLYIDFVEANKDEKNIQFLATAMTNESQKGASVYLYKDGFLVNENFEPPSKPETPTASDITHNNVTLKMYPPRFGAEDSHYCIEHCVTGQDSWQQQTASIADEVTVSNLTPNTEYTFRYRAVCPVGRGPDSKDSGSMKTLPSSPPEKLQVEAYSDQLFAKWERPTELADGVKVESYSVEYSKVSTGMKNEQLQWNKVASNAENAIITGLEPLTDYVVRVRCDCGVAGRSKESIAVTIQTTKTIRLAEFYRLESELINSGPLSVYRLPLKMNEIDIDGCKSYSIGKESIRPNRTIMVLGATGAGKTTLINGMINYLLCINWNDDYRFKLIDEGQLVDQAESQTSEVIAYKMNHQEGFKVPYSLTIVDTPGFGDTRGIERDREITEKIRNLFGSEVGVNEIDIACFVTQASHARLTHTQKYVFDSVLSMMLVTFADSQTPPVLGAIIASNVPCPKTDAGLPIYFKFNNSAFFAEKRSPRERDCDEDEDSDEDNFDQMFWNMGMKSLKHFFAALGKMETNGLELTKEVLKERKRLETAIKGIQPQVKAGIEKLEEIRMTEQKIKEHEAAMSTNEKFEIEIPIERTLQVPITKAGEFSTNCETCKHTCHYPCLIANDIQKKLCAAMDDSGKCTVCLRKCMWKDHKNQNYRWDVVTVKEKQTLKDLQEKYKIATQAKMSVQDVIERLKEDSKNLKAVIMSLVQQAAACFARLNEIALRANPLSAPEYIDILIDGEKSEAKEGYKSRIKSLEDMKEQAKIISKVAKQEDVLS